MKTIVELLSILEGNMSYTEQQIKTGIEDFAKNFMYKADKFMPEIQEYEEELESMNNGKGPNDADWKQEAENFIDEYFPRYAEGDKKLNQFLMQNHRDELLVAIGDALKENFEAR